MKILVKITVISTRYQLRREKLCIQNRYNSQLTHKYKTTKTNQLNLYHQ
ncbi:hypothetical protein bcgnr5406_58360 [Bacillus cereus]